MPDLTCDLPTLPQSALIYRLSGDYNPLHADPAYAKKAGYKMPIFTGGALSVSQGMRCSRRAAATILRV